MDDIIQQLADAGIAIPDGIEFSERATQRNWRRVVVRSEASSIYGSDDTWMEFEMVGPRLKVEHLRSLASHARTHDSNWRSIASIDHALDLTGRGRDLVPVGFDAAFVNWCARQGVTLDDLSKSVRRWMSSFRHTHDILDAERTAFTNCDREFIRNYFPAPYRNMVELRHGIADRLEFFQGCIWGRKPFAFDFVLGSAEQHRYQSSSMPTLILDMQVPDSVMKSAKGAKVNELVGMDIFGESQKVVRAWSQNGRLMVSMTPEIIALSPIDRTTAAPMRLAA